MSTTAGVLLNEMAQLANIYTTILPYTFLQPGTAYNFATHHYPTNSLYSEHSSHTMKNLRSLPAWSYSLNAMTQPNNAQPSHNPYLPGTYKVAETVSTTTHHHQQPTTTTTNPLEAKISQNSTHRTAPFVKPYASFSFYRNKYFIVPAITVLVLKMLYDTHSSQYHRQRATKRADEFMAPLWESYDDIFGDYTYDYDNLVQQLKLREAVNKPKNVSSRVNRVSEDSSSAPSIATVKSSVSVARKEMQNKIVNHSNKNAHDQFEHHWWY